MLMRCAPLSVVLLTGACATSVATVPVDMPPPASPVQIQLAEPPAAAFDQVVAAFMAEGFTIDQGDPASGLIKTAGVPGDPVIASNMGATVMMTPTHFYRATITPRQGGSTVSLSVTGRASVTTNGRAEPPLEEMPLYQCPTGDSEPNRICRATYEKIQTRLNQIAARLRGA